LTNISAIADIGIVRVSDNAAANDDVKKQPLTSTNNNNDAVTTSVCFAVAT